MSNMRIKYLPIIHIQQQLNSNRAQHIIDSIQKISKLQIAAVALIVELPSQRAVQVDKLVQKLHQLRTQNNFQIYGFTTSLCSPQSYYMLSISNKIFTSPTTLFTFQRHAQKLDFQQFYRRLSLNRVTIGSSQNLLGRYIDSFTSPDWIPIGNQKKSDIDQRLMRYSLMNRFQIGNNNLSPPQKIPSVLLGEDAKLQNLVDGFGSYQNILKQNFPDAKLMRLNSADEMKSVLNTILLITSPFLVLLFLFKVALKYTIVMYIWLKAKATNKKLAQVAQQDGYQLDSDQMQWIKQYDSEELVNDST